MDEFYIKITLCFNLGQVYSLFYLFKKSTCSNYIIGMQNGIYFNNCSFVVGLLNGLSRNRSVI